MPPSYRTEKFDSIRRLSMDTCSLGLKKNYIKAFLEIDVTLLRKKLQQAKQSGQRLSFTATMVRLLAETMNDFPEVNAYLKGEKARIIFNQIDLSIAVEKSRGGESFPMPYVIRDVMSKSIEEISEEIRSVQSESVKDKDVVLGEKSPFLERMFSHFPRFLRQIIWKSILKNPVGLNKRMGTAMITSLGMFGRLPGFVEPIPIHTLSMAVGGIEKKPRFISGEFSDREILHLTLMVDHDVLDGAPAARMISNLVKRFENPRSFAEEK